jgi:pyridoxal phosphate enzyme (YggS family)
MNILNNYKKVTKDISLLNKNITLIIVTKTHPFNYIKPLIDIGHLDFGENKVQEAIIKWKNILVLNKNIKLHMLGKLQSNKAKVAFEIFNYIHSLDNEKLAQIFARLESNSLKKVKYFIQVNVGNEPQKSGIAVNQLNQFVKFCINDLKLNVIGLMCLPPIKEDPIHYFRNLAELANENKLSELSMGMSTDYETAIINGATFVRIGSKIFTVN